MKITACRVRTPFSRRTPRVRKIAVGPKYQTNFDGEFSAALAVMDGAGAPVDMFVVSFSATEALHFAEYVKTELARHSLRAAPGSHNENNARDQTPAVPRGSLHPDPKR